MADNESTSGKRLRKDGKERKPNARIKPTLQLADLPELVTEQQACAFYGCSVSTLRARIAEGLFPAPRVLGGEAKRFLRSDLERWLNELPPSTVALTGTVIVERDKYGQAVRTRQHAGGEPLAASA